jgi:hypothetical protein
MYVRVHKQKIDTKNSSGHDRPILVTGDAGAVGVFGDTWIA